jgi:hypothetical protein
MPDASPADAVIEGQEPDDGEGQEPEPDNGDDSEDEPEGRSPKQYPEHYVRQLRKEAASQRNRVAELEEKLQEHTDAGKSEHEKLVEKLTASERRAGDAELKLLRFEVAREAGLDLDAAAFLTGSTREEIEHRAAELAKLLAEKGPGKSSTGFDGGARQTAPKEQGPPEQEHNEFLMRAIRGAPSSQ